MTQARVRGYALRERGPRARTRAVSVTFEMPQRNGPPVLAALTIAAIARRLTTARVREITRSSSRVRTRNRARLGRGEELFQQRQVTPASDRDGPSARAVEGDHARILEVLGAAVRLGVGGPALAAVNRAGSGT